MENTHLVKPNFDQRRRLLPDGVLIKSALFSRLAFKLRDGKMTTAQYRLEVGIDDNDENEDIINQMCAEACYLDGGKQARDDYMNEAIQSPIKDGNEMAKKKKEDGRAYDLYVDKMIIHANNTHNKWGKNAEGGIKVIDQSLHDISAAEQDRVSPGCEISVVVVPKFLPRINRVLLILDSVQVISETRTSHNLFKMR